MPGWATRTDGSHWPIGAQGMEPLRRNRRDDPYADETLRQIGQRAPGGLVFFVVCVVLSSGFEIARFPERRPWMLSFAAAFIALSALCWLALRRYTARRIEILIVFVNVVGIALNAYHAIVGASVAMCLWTLTGLMGSTAIFLRWGGGNQALASLGALLFYPLHLAMGNVDVLIWSAGGTYLAFIAAMSVFGSELYARYLRSGIQLSRALSEREARLQSYFDLAPVGTAVLAPDCGFTEVNDALCRVLGHSREELLARCWLDVAAADERGAAEAQVAGALAGAAQNRLSETRLVRKDGVTIDVAIDARGLPGSRGTIDHVMVLVQDVTARKRADAERERMLAAELDARRHAEAASRAKDDFLRPVDFAPVVLEAVDVIRHAADAKGIDLDVDIEAAARAPRARRRRRSGLERGRAHRARLLWRRCPDRRLRARGARDPRPMATRCRRERPRDARRGRLCAARAHARAR